MSVAEYAVYATMTDLSSELGDDMPASSLSRLRRMMEHEHIAPELMHKLLLQAREATLAYAATIWRRSCTHPKRVNMTPYFFAVLCALVAPPLSQALRPRGRTGGSHPPLHPIVSMASPPAPIINESNTTWRAVLEEMALVLTSENFMTWFAPTRAVREEGSLLTVAAPSTFHRDWLQQKLHRRIAAMLAQLGYPGMQVEYVVAGA